MNTEQRLRSIVENRCTVLLCTPTYALHMAELAAQYRCDLAGSPVRTTIHAGEPGASVPNVRALIERSWGARCFDHAGSTEVGAWAFQCQADSGAVHLNETEFIAEVIDSTTGEPVQEGERGELVLTTLGRPGMPVLRYRTGDLVEVTTEPCKCGRTLSRALGGVLGRADDMIIVRGVNLYPSVIDNLIRGLAVVVEYDVEITRVAGLDELAFEIEIAEGRSFTEVEAAFKKAFRSEFNIRVNVSQATAGSLPRYEFKARRYRRVSG
jgi:phenylacetate-CoA ligase